MDKNKFLIDLSETDRTDFGKKKFSEQSHPQKVFSAIWAVESEVNNGGFAQYFENESGETAHFVAEALDTVEAPLTAAICRRAISTAFPDGLPEAPGAIGITASDFSDDTLGELAELDDEFIQYPHNLTELLFEYVAKHPEEFGEVAG
jgi:hypothetical protein